MREDYSLLTPENVELHFDVAGLGSRLMAATIDYTLLVFGYLVLFFAAVFISARVSIAFGLNEASHPELTQWLGGIAIAGSILLAFFGWWGYFILGEMVWNGQTIGKRMFRLRVVSSTGQPVGLTASIVRNVMRIVDILLFIGVLVMLIDRSSRRLGDLAAGTLVVREPRAVSADALQAVDIPRVPAAALAEALPNADRLNMAHYTLVRDYFSRRWQLPVRRAEQIAGSLALDLARVLEIDRSDIGDPVMFLATTARAYEARHLYADAMPRETSVTENS